MEAGHSAKYAAFQALSQLYAEVDGLLASYTCDATAACCKFGVTGREPYMSTLELDYLRRHLRASPPPKRGTSKRLPVRGPSEGRCELLGEDLRCGAYAARPLGCRTFFCERMAGPGKFPRARVAEVLRRLASLAEAYAPRDPGPHRMSRASLR